MNRYLLFFIAGITIIIGLLFSLILFLRLLDYWKSWSYAKRSKAWESLFFFYLSDIISLEEAVKGFGMRYQQMWAFFLPYLRSIRGEEFGKLKQLIQKTGLSHYYLKKIRHGSLKAKVKAATVMGAIGNKEALPEIQELLQSEDNEIASIAAQTLSDLGEARMLIPVMQRILSQSYATFEGTTGLTVRFGREVCPIIVELIYSWQAGEVDLQELFSVPYYQSLSLFIDILGHHHYRDDSEVYDSLLQEKEHPEVLIHLFKTLSKIGQPVLVDLLPFLQHEDWVVRSQTARFVGQIQNRKYIDELIEMLGDESWWVKYHAGEALLFLGERKLLRNIASAGGPGAAMSSYILSKERKPDDEEDPMGDGESKTIDEELGIDLEEDLEEEPPIGFRYQKEQQISLDISQELVEIEEGLILFLRMVDDFSSMAREKIPILKTNFKVMDTIRSIHSLKTFLEGIIIHYSINVDAHEIKTRLLQLDRMGATLSHVADTFYDMDLFLLLIEKISRGLRDALKKIALDYEHQKERLEKILAFLTILKDKNQEFISIMKKETQVPIAYILFMEKSFNLLDRSTQVTLDAMLSTSKGSACFYLALLEQLEEILLLYPSRLDENLLEANPLQEWAEELERDDKREQIPSFSSISDLIDQMEEQINGIERKLEVFSIAQFQFKIELARLGVNFFSLYSQQMKGDLQGLPQLVEGRKEACSCLKEETGNVEALNRLKDDKELFSMNKCKSLQISLEELKRAKRKLYHGASSLYEEIYEFQKEFSSIHSGLKEIDLERMKKEISLHYPILKEEIQQLLHGFKEIPMEDRVNEDLSTIYSSFAKDLVCK